MICPKCNKRCETTHDTDGELVAVCDGCGYAWRLSTALEFARGQTAKNKRMSQDYELFEEIAPPDVPRAEFVKWCYDAWDSRNEAGQDAVTMQKEIDDLKSENENLHGSVKCWRTRYEQQLKRAQKAESANTSGVSEEEKG